MIIGIQGIHPESGLTNEFLPEAVLDRVLVTFAPQLIIVADSSKIGKIKASAVGRIEDIGVLVTDSAIDPALVGAPAAARYSRYAGGRVAANRSVASRLIARAEYRAIADTIPRPRPPRPSGRIDASTPAQKEQDRHRGEGDDQHGARQRVDRRRGAGVHGSEHVERQRVGAPDEEEGARIFVE